MILTIFYSSIITIVSILILKPLSIPMKLIDEPNYRKIHDEPTPMIGGLAIYLSIFITSQIIDLPKQIDIVIFSSFIVLFIGLLDDIYNLGVIIRLIAQILASCIVFFSGLAIIDLGNFSYFGIISIGIFSGFFTIFSVISLTNAFNFIDGLDGLAGGLALVALISMFLFQYFNNATINSEIFIILFIPIFIYWLINISLTPFKKIFLGDSGSLLLGFLVSWLLIYSAYPGTRFFHPILVLWCVTIPVYDIVSVVTRRIALRKSIFKHDLLHIHHLFLNYGYSKYSALFIILFLGSIFSFVGFISYMISGPILSLSLFFVFLIIYCFLSYHFMKKEI